MTDTPKVEIDPKAPAVVETTKPETVGPVIATPTVEAPAVDKK